MNIKTARHFIATCAIAIAYLSLPTTAHALSASKYTTQSQLATGRWVKIAIPEDGIYELTEQELLEMGFADASRVKLFGQGGHMIKELLDNTFTDDLTPVPVARMDGKMCFYACGPVNVYYNVSSESFTRSINAYSTMGYYFLTDADDKPSAAVTKSEPVMLRVNHVHTTSFDYTYHEIDQYSFGMTGKALMGENITTGGKFDVSMPGNKGYVVRARINAGAKLISGKTNLKATLAANGTTMPLTLSKSDVSANAANYYGECNTATTIITDTPITQGTLNLSFDVSAGVMSHARLDNYIFTYTHANSMEYSTDNQLRMVFSEFETGDIMALEKSEPSTRVWDVSNPAKPVELPLFDTEYGRIFVASDTMFTQCVAFTPAAQLKKIAAFEPIDNQNLHGMNVPHMLIITNNEFMEQAQRIVQMHALTDGLEVVAVDQEDIFNEFSSGTPDAMAYRLLCKMLYDRDSDKFKYLLLLGEGSYDNRGLATNKKNRIITYQTDNSNNEISSYTTDDFFGFLEDNSGGTLSSSRLSIGIGRIPSANAQEAASDIDKLVKYVTAPDYGPWRNNLFFSAEYKDGESNPDLHQSQAEMLTRIVEEDINSSFAFDKAYVNMYPKAVGEEILSEHSRTAAEANRHFNEAMQRGQFFATYVGHAGPKAFTNSRMWTIDDVMSKNYDHLPIFTTACCDVACFDSDQRGIAEQMFHRPQGGAIALLTSTRQVLATGNDNLNRAWIKTMFDWNKSGTFHTLGEINKLAKLSLGGNTTNHHKYVLLGDPAMRITYPVPLFQITSINGTDVTAPDAAASTQPLQHINVTAQVLTPDRSAIDTDFNGDATLTIYDLSRFFRTANQTMTNYIVDMYYPRDILTQVTGRVENGIFHGTAVMPRYCRAVNQLGSITVFAHKDNTDFMVNGSFSNLTIKQFTQPETDDNEPPVIASMYLNDEETFGASTTVAPNSTLYVHATDNLAINNQSGSMGSNMRLVLDGGKKSFYTVGNNARVTQQGQSLDIAFPLNGLTTGSHSLTLTIHDAAGNATSRTISFNVGKKETVKLTVAQQPATTQATINASQDPLAPVSIKVNDAMGHLVWSTAATSFPVTWDLRDNYGRRVPGGLYRVSGTFENEGTTGATNTADIIVINRQNSPIKK